MMTSIQWFYRLIVPRHGSSRLMAWLAIASVAMGMSALIVTQSVVSGFERAYEDGILHFSPHIEVMGEEGGMPQEAAVETLARSLAASAILVRRILPYRYREGLVVSHGVVRGVAIRGLSLNDWRDVTQVAVRQAPPVHDSRLAEVWLGETLARQLNAQLGDTISIMIPTSQDKNNDIDVEQWMVTVRVAATFTSGLYDQDSQFVLMESDTAARLFGMAGHISAMEIYLADPAQAPSVAGMLRHRFPEWYAQPWQEANRSLFEAIAMERVMFVIVIGVLLVVACCNIISAIILCVLLHRHSMSIWRAMGMSATQVVRLFVIYGLVIGFIGVFFGVSIGSGLVMLLHVTQWIPLSNEVYLISKLPATLSPVILLACSTGALSVSLLTAWVASRRVLTMPIIDGLRKAV